MNRKFILAAVLLAMMGCGKYEDGPWISLTSIENRLLGHYHVQSVTMNGTDQMNRIDTLEIDFYSIESEYDVNTDQYLGKFSVNLNDTSYWTSWHKMPLATPKRCPVIAALPLW